ncbi:DNA helicase [Trifolium repens]|nr:DNA helicase [Trifolium repens]
MEENQISPMSDSSVSSPKTILEDVSGVDPKTLFPVIRLSFQNYGEVDPSFHQEFLNQLGKEWYILSSNGVYHKCIFNCNPKFPLITEGWEELKKCEGFGDNVNVDLAYYGGNLFSVVYVKVITSCVDIMPFHSRSLKPKQTFVFDIPLSHEMTKKKRIVE